MLTKAPFIPTVIALTLCLSVSSCDVVSSPVLCNGFGEAIYVTTEWKGSDRMGTATITSSQCKALDVISADKLTTSDEFRAPDGYVGIVRAFSVSNELRGRYLVPARMNLGGLGQHSPRWLINREGLFHVAYDLEPDWKNNVAVIQKSATISLPNTAR
jgi:hypothetical protein